MQLFGCAACARELITAQIVVQQGRVDELVDLTITVGHDGNVEKAIVIHNGNGLCLRHYAMSLTLEGVRLEQP